MPTFSVKSTIRDLSYKPKQRLQIFRELSVSDQLEVLKQVTQYIRKEIVTQLTEDELILLIEKLDPVMGTDLLQLLTSKKRNSILEKISARLKEELSLLLSFDPNTAAGLMNLNYILTNETDTIGQIAEKVKLHESRTGKIPIILVESATGLHNCLPIHRLALADRSDLAQPHIQKIATLQHTVKSTDVLSFFKKHPHSKALVLGERQNVMGVIYSDDVLRLIEERSSSSLYNFAGVTAEESIYDSLKRKVNFRYKWLILNLGTAFLAAFTVGIFEDVIAKQVLLAVYMPIVAGMGGNAGTQTLAVMVRGLGQQELGWKDINVVLRNEVGAGLVNGCINGLIVFAIVVLINKNVLVATVLAAAMVVNLLIAATFGTLVPVAMKKLGKDPASSATIFITTATDIFGFMAFLGLAKLLLH